MQNTPPKPFMYDPPLDPYLEVMHQDDDLIVLSKPANLLSVAGKALEHADCLETRAQETFPSATIVHRLDRGTSGLMVMALNMDAHRNISTQFEKRRTHKTYIARVFGHDIKDTGHIDLPLLCDWPNRPKQMVCHEKGKSSQTDWEVIEREENNVTRLRLRPITGRTHQLRVHVQQIGYPILGDHFYAPPDVENMAERLQLHAQSLTLFHPSDSQKVTYTVPCPF